MKNIKIIVSYGFLGGFMLILIHLLSSKIYYIAGLLIPFAFIISIWLALKHTYRIFKYFNFLFFFKKSISVFLVSYLINIIYTFLTNAILGDIKENFIAYGIGLFLGIILSFAITTAFKLFGVKKNILEK